MKFDELIAKAKKSLDVKMVFAEPYERDGVTVIAAARVTGGGGGGTGREKGLEGGGGGFGLIARPVGAYIIKGGKVRWEPAVDINRLLGTVGAIAVAALFVTARVIKIRAKSAGHPAPGTSSEPGQISRREGDADPLIQDPAQAGSIVNE